MCFLRGTDVLNHIIPESYDLTLSQRWRLNIILPTLGSLFTKFWVLSQVVLWVAGFCCNDFMILWFLFFELAYLREKW